MATPKKPASTPPKMGRPTKRTEQVIERILSALSDGTPLAVICRADDMPDPVNVRRWAQDDERLSHCIAHAREIGFDSIAGRARETARGMGDSSGDYLRDKLIIETDLKLLAKWDPKRYGERIRQEHTGKDGEPITTVQALSPELEAQILSRTAAGAAIAAGVVAPASFRGQGSEEEE